MKPEEPRQLGLEHAQGSGDDRVVGPDEHLSAESPRFSLKGSLKRILGHTRARYYQLPWEYFGPIELQ